MRRASILLALALLAAPLGGQTVAKRDSAVADSVVVLKRGVQTGRDRNKLDSLARVLRSPVVAPPPPPPPPVLPPLPKAIIGTSCLDLTCALSGVGSTGARLTFLWHLGASADGVNEATANGPSVTYTYVHPGERTVVLEVTDSLGRKTTASKTFTASGQIVVIDTQKPPPLPPPPPRPPPPPPPADTTSQPKRAEMPRVVPAFSVPTPTRSYRIGTDLQRALDTVKVNDELRLSGTYVGNFVVRSCFGGWITLRTNAADSLLPAVGQRFTSRYAAFAPAIQTPNVGAALTVYGCNVKMLGLEVTATAGAARRGIAVNYGLVWFGDGGQTADGAVGQTTLAKVPQNLWLDRSWVHGQDSTNTTRCLALNSGATIVSNSSFTNCHANGNDSQAIEGWNGPGPYLIDNNDLQGAAENLMFGGGDPAIQGLSPSDITITRNWIHKDPSWRGLWTIKNLTELKNARRVLYENNVLSDTWPGGQDMAVVFKSSQDACGVCTWQGTQDVTFRWNVVRNAPGGFNAQGYDESGQVKTLVHTARITVENNLFENIGAEGQARLMLLTHDIADAWINQNTFLHAPSIGAAGGSFATMDVGNGQARRLWITNNLATAGAYGVFYSGGAIGTAAMEQMVGDRSWRLTGNALVYGAPLASRFPLGNTFPTTIPVTPGVDRAELARRTAGVVVP